MFKENITAEQMGRYLRHYRRKAGLSAKEVAALLGRDGSLQVIYNMEAGRATVSPEDMYRLLLIYRVPLNRAFSEDLEIVAEEAHAKQPGLQRARKMALLFPQLSALDQRMLLRIAEMAIGKDGAVNPERAADAERCACE